MKYKLVFSKLHHIMWRLDWLKSIKAKLDYEINDVCDGLDLNSVIIYEMKVGESVCSSGIIFRLFMSKRQWNTNWSLPNCIIF